MFVFFEQCSTLNMGFKWKWRRKLPSPIRQQFCVYTNVRVSQPDNSVIKQSQLIELICIALSTEWGRAALTCIERLMICDTLIHRLKWMPGSLISIKGGDGAGIQAMLRGSPLRMMYHYQQPGCMHTLIFVSTFDRIPEQPHVAPESHRESKWW